MQNLPSPFNANLMDVDHALLRHGRLIAEYQFDKLSVAKANAYLKSVGKDIKVTEPKSLAEVTNIDEEYYRQENNDTGFGFV